MSAKLIEARILKGFRDCLPQVALARVELLDRIRRVFLRFGYAPIETPALEYTEILLGKGSAETDKQLYRFADQGQRDIALRFDLTVPLARFAAMHCPTLGVPFRRYHIAPVWRAEKPQRGRYREFTQCDFDIIGTRAPLADAEIILMIDQIFQALEIPHLIRFNHRGILNGFLQQIDAHQHLTTVLRAIDKLEKLGVDVVREELLEAQLSPTKVDEIFSFIELSRQILEPASLISALRERVGDNATALGALENVAAISAALEHSVVSGVCRLDLSIARGLDYYTGVVFETQATELPDIGSICSGGRYDNLAGLFTKQDLPGVGASVGLDRTLAALEELGRLSAKHTTASVLVTFLDCGTEAKAMSLAQQIRALGVDVELYPEAHKLGAQLKYADRKGIEILVFAGAREFEQGSFTIKEMKSGEQHQNIPFAEVPQKVAELVRNKW